MRVWHEDQRRFSNGNLGKDENGFILTPRKVILITPETVEEANFLNAILDRIKSECIGRTSQGDIVISVLDNELHGHNIKHNETDRT